MNSALVSNLGRPIDEAVVGSVRLGFSTEELSAADSLLAADGNDKCEKASGERSFSDCGFAETGGEKASGERGFSDCGLAETGGENDDGERGFSDCGFTETGGENDDGERGFSDCGFAEASGETAGLRRVLSDLRDGGLRLSKLLLEDSSSDESTCLLTRLRPSLLWIVIFTCTSVLCGGDGEAAGLGGAACSTEGPSVADSLLAGGGLDGGLDGGLGGGGLDGGGCSDGHSH